jgi:hypothetical protein
MTIIFRRMAYLIILSLIWSGCGGVEEETVGGVAIPIPPGLKRVERQGVELSLPGFSGETASFEGELNPAKVTEFYKKELPERGWKPSLGIVSQGGMLAFTKEGKTVLLGIGKSNGSTSLSIMVGTTRN